MKNRQFRISRLYRYFAPIYLHIRPFWTGILARQAERYLEREALPASLHPKANVLDLGCGPGVNQARLRRLNLPFANYVGLDLSPDMLKRSGYEASGQNVLVGSANYIPFQSNSFDLILSTWMFSHLLKPVSVVREAQRLLRPNGWLVIVCFSGSGFLAGVLRDFIDRVFIMQFVPINEIETWPGLVDVRSFAGGWVTVARLQRET